MNRSISPVVVIVVVVLIALLCATVAMVGSCSKKAAERAEAEAVRNTDGPGGEELPMGSPGSGRELGGARKTE